MVVLNLFKILKDNSIKLSLLMLNTPLTPIESIFYNLSHKADVSIFIDGFCNEIFSHALQSTFKPTFISGDFDSITPSVLKFYENDPQVGVHHTPDQSLTDFTKALKLLCQNSSIQSMDYIVALHSKPGTRLDHELEHFNTLYVMQPQIQAPIILLSDCNLSTVLLPGEHTIQIDPQINSNHCGIIPLDGPAVVSSTGLKYNMDNLELRFGKIISTSNSFDGSGSVNLTTDSAVIWTMDYNL